MFNADGWSGLVMTPRMMGRRWRRWRTHCFLISRLLERLLPGSNLWFCCFSRVTGAEQTKRNMASTVTSTITSTRITTNHVESSATNQIRESDQEATNKPCHQNQWKHIFSSPVSRLQPFALLTERLHTGATHTHLFAHNEAP